MNQKFQYSVLKYRPSYLLDERVNIGLLFHFEDVHSYEKEIFDLSKFVFIYPPKLRRISQFFPAIAGSKLIEIKRYLRAFKETAKESSWLIALQDKSLDEVIKTKFIINDANSFFFSEVKKGFYNDKQSVEKTIEYYEKQYFKHYNFTKTKKTQDVIVKEFFQKSLNELVTPKDIRLKYFEEGINIQNKITTSKFEYRWQNGTSNLIKTLGFDLSDKQDIQDKAFKWSSAINYINELGKYQNYHFDILVSRPKKKELFKAYDIAINILDDIKANKKIIPPEEIKNYAEKALNTIKPFRE